MAFVFNKIEFAQNISYGRAVLKKITNKFDAYAPPLTLKNNLVQIYIDISKTLEVDEKGGTITLKLTSLYIYGSDDAKWNPEDYHGVEHIDVPQGTFWKARIGKNLFIRESVEWALGSIKLKYLKLQSN